MCLREIGMICYFILEISFWRSGSSLKTMVSSEAGNKFHSYSADISPKSGASLWPNLTQTWSLSADINSPGFPLGINLSSLWTVCCWITYPYKFDPDQGWVCYVLSSSYPQHRSYASFRLPGGLWENKLILMQHELTYEQMWTGRTGLY